jgi:glucosamine-6-phosphate deaminase
MNGVLVVDDERVASTAADVVQSTLPAAQPRLGVATGSTPMGLYAELARRVRSGTWTLAGATLIALDEYVGLGADDPHSYAAFVRDVIARPLGVPPENVLVPDGLAADPDKEAAAFEAHIGAIGGVDLQILGIGTNGHLAFNEPGSDLDSATRTVTLDEQTRRDNARFFAGRIGDVPSRAITQGLGTIGRARSILLLVTGERKARALAAALNGPVTPRAPASALQRHRSVTVVADRTAARLLRYSGWA